MTKLNIKKIVENLVQTFLEAGKISLELRNKGLIKKIKSDNTPVSNGDLEINKILINEISKLTPDIPIISEESSENKSIKDLKNFWLIDPIDGTYDYINDLNEFTINAGLILNNKPAAGLICAPALNRMFYSFGDNSAFELINDKPIKLECTRKFNRNDIRFVSYSNNTKPEIQTIYNKLKVKKNFRMKSSLKFCVIACGEYDGYVAEPRASEWDIAAGHAILIHAGGVVTDFDGNEILYGKRNFKNPSLILRNKYIK